MSEAGTVFDSMVSGNTAHAYIIEGPAGEARTRFVKDIVKAMLCEDRDPVTGRACGMCPSCRKIEYGTHEDVFEMQRSGKTMYVVGDAVKMMERLALRPYGEYNVGIVDDADLLSETVQNKLLKTLEEPSPGTIIFLAVANRASLLPTVRSRCALIRMENVGGSGISAEVDDAAGELYDMYVNGCFFYEFRDHIKKNFKTREYAVAFLDVLEEKTGSDMVSDSVLSDQSDRDVFVIKAVERTRMDMAAGMGYKPALKRLFLELR